MRLTSNRLFGISFLSDVTQLCTLLRQQHLGMGQIIFFLLKRSVPACGGVHAGTPGSLQRATIPWSCAPTVDPRYYNRVLFCISTRRGVMHAGNAYNFVAVSAFFHWAQGSQIVSRIRYLMFSTSVNHHPLIQGFRQFAVSIYSPFMCFHILTTSTWFPSCTQTPPNATGHHPYHRPPPLPPRPTDPMTPPETTHTQEKSHLMVG